MTADALHSRGRQSLHVLREVAVWNVFLDISLILYYVMLYDAILHIHFSIDYF